MLCCYANKALWISPAVYSLHLCKIECMQSINLYKLCLIPYYIIWLAVPRVTQSIFNYKIWWWWWWWVRKGTGWWGWYGREKERETRKDRRADSTVQTVSWPWWDDTYLHCIFLPRTAIILTLKIIVLLDALVIMAKLHKIFILPYIRS